MSPEKVLISAEGRPLSATTAPFGLSTRRVQGGGEKQHYSSLFKRVKKEKKFGLLSRCTFLRLLGKNQLTLHPSARNSRLQHGAVWCYLQLIFPAICPCVRLSVSALRFGVIKSRCERGHDSPGRRPRAAGKRRRAVTLRPSGSGQKKKNPCGESNRGIQRPRV